VRARENERAGWPGHPARWKGFDVVAHGTTGSCSVLPWRPRT
jgi:hypothetical protein